MNILVLNSGSSSVKYQLISMPHEEVMCSGMIERIGLDDPVITYKTSEKKIERKIQVKDHGSALAYISKLLMDDQDGVIKHKDDINAVGHRVVHGGVLFTDTVIVDEKVKRAIDSLAALAPLHNPPNLEGIRVAEHTFPNARQVAVFDTAFHQSIPKKASTYAIPRSLSEEYNIKLYGFHGTSHKYVSEKANQHLQHKNTKLITLHLGNGCSASAILNGKCIDHSLGFGPVNGLVMGTRSGDIDQSVIFYLMKQLDLSSEEVNAILQKQSGMLGLTGFSDLRDIEGAAKAGDQQCQLALAISAYRIKKYIGSYVAAMDGIDAIIFTAGIGEHSATMRKLVCQDMNFFGIELDEEKNLGKITHCTEIQKDTSKVTLLVIPTNEELEIAKQCYQLVEK